MRRVGIRSIHIRSTEPNRTERKPKLPKNIQKEKKTKYSKNLTYLQREREKDMNDHEDIVYQVISCPYTHCR